MVFSKNSELASLRQHGFLNEKSIDFLNAFFLRRKYSTVQNNFASYQCPVEITFYGKGSSYDL